MPYVVSRPLRGYDDITRPDASARLRAELLGYWGVGQHLWDIALNGNLDHCSFWLAATAHFNRDPRPNWPPLMASDTRVWINKQFIDQSALREGNPDWPDRDYALADIQPGDICLYAPGSPVTVVHKPFVGAKLYVAADYQHLVWDGTAWRVAFEAPPFKRRLEISIFVSASRAGAEAARHIVQEPFVIPKEGFFSTASSVPGRPSDDRPFTPAQVRRNGEQVGHYVRGDHGEVNLVLAEDAPFGAGDILSIHCDAALVNASFSIVGKRS